MSDSKATSDVYGLALYDYYRYGKADELKLHTSYGEIEVMPVDWFFRDEGDFPELERIALGMAQGATLDIGAGAGSHAVFLYDKGVAIHTLDTSDYCVKIMRERGLPNVLHQSVWQPLPRRFDTLLLLMNGIGLVEDLSKLRSFFKIAHDRLNPGGRILLDSSDLSYLYDDQDVFARPELGKIQYQYEYRGVKGAKFSWLYVDFRTLKQIAEEEGWNARLIFEDTYAQYLAYLSRI